MRISGLKAGLHPGHFYCDNPAARLLARCVAPLNSRQLNTVIYLLRWDD